MGCARVAEGALMDTIIRKAKNPGELRFVAMADAHLCAFDPPSWKISFLEHSQDTLRQIFKFAVKVNADGILWAGDQFHRKSSTNNPLWFVSTIIRLFKEPEEAGIENLGIAGNHDIKFGSIEKGLEGQALETLIAAGVFRLLDAQEYLYEADGFKVRVAGASFEHGRAEGCRDKKKDGADYLISLGHFWFGKASGEFFGEHLYGPDFLGTGEPDLYVIGHHHEDQGVQEEGGKYYVAPGSINRTGGKESDLLRRPAASLITISKEGIKVQVLRPKVREATDVIDLEVRQQVLEERKEMESFINSLHQAEVEATDPDEIMGEMGLTQEVRDRARKYIEQAEEVSCTSSKKTTEGT